MLYVVYKLVRLAGDAWCMKMGMGNMVGYSYLRHDFLAAVRLSRHDLQYMT